jgi:hypothetical protein
MPGLGPGIHQTVKEFLAGETDYRVKPGNDG